jgi:hypothetical protein
VAREVFRKLKAERRPLRFATTRRGHPEGGRGAAHDRFGQSSGAAHGCCKRAPHYKTPGGGPVTRHQLTTEWARWHRRSRGSAYPWTPRAAAASTAAAAAEAAGPDCLRLVYQYTSVPIHTRRVHLPSLSLATTRYVLLPTSTRSLARLVPSLFARSAQGPGRRRRAPRPQRRADPDPSSYHRGPRHRLPAHAAVPALPRHPLRWRPEDGGLHSSTSQLNLSRVVTRKHPANPTPPTKPP